MRLFKYALLVLSMVGLSLNNTATAQTPPPLSAYGALPAVEDVAVSPSGSSIAIVKSVAGKRAIILMGNDLAVKNAINIGDLKVRSMRFIDDDRLLIIRSRTETLGRMFAASKIEVSQGIVLSADKLSQPGVIFGKQSGIENGIFGSYGVRRNGDSAKAYFGAIELARHDRGHYYFEHGRPSLFEVDLKTLKPKRLDRASSPTREKKWVVDANGQIAATFRIDREDGQWFIKNATGDTIAEGQSPTGGAGMLGLSENGDHLLYYERAAPDSSVEWYKVPLAGGAGSTVFLADVNVDRLFWDGSTGHLMGYFEEAPSEKAVFFDPKQKRTASAVRKAFDGIDARIVEWSDDFRKIVVRTRGNQNSGIWFLVDLDKGGAVAIGDERPAIPGEAVGAISTFAYTAQDGLEMDGILTLPPGQEASNLPLVMMPHGGPASHDTETFHWKAQAFASRGYAVFQPNFRGSTNKDAAFTQAGKGEWGGKMQTDISDGLAALAEKGIIDPARVCIMGASYGGYAALAGVTIQNDLYRCAVAVAPVSDLTKFYDQRLLERGSRGTSETSLLLQFGPEDNFDAVSPYRLTEKADAPVLLIHGQDDTVVPFRQSRIMADALKDAGKPHEFVKLDSGDHWLTLAESRQRMLEEAMRFVQEHNPAQ